jgi:hypothetical protein
MGADVSSDLPSEMAMTEGGPDQTSDQTGDAGTTCQLPATITADYAVPDTCTVVEIAQDVAVNGGVLTIGPGVLLRFAAGVHLTIGKTAPGGLKIQGTSQQLARLSVAGDGSSGTRWGGIELGPFTSSGTLIDYAIIEYAGQGAGPALTIDESVLDNSVTITNTTIRYCDGIPVVNGTPGSLFADFSGNTVENNQGKFSMTVGARVVGSIKTSNAFESAISIPGGDIESDTVWSAQSTQLVINGIVLVAGPTTVAKLTIQSPNTLQFAKGTYLFIGPSAVKPGALDVDGVSFSPRSASPVLGEWSGIQFGNGAEASTINDCQFSWAGKAANAGNNTGVITINEPSSAAGITVTNSSMTNSGSTYSVLVVDGQQSDCDKYSVSTAQNTFDKDVYCGAL